MCICAVCFCVCRRVQTCQVSRLASNQSHRYVALDVKLWLVAIFVTSQRLPGIPVCQTSQDVSARRKIEPHLRQRGLFPKSLTCHRFHTMCCPGLKAVMQGLLLDLVPVTTTLIGLAA